MILGTPQLYVNIIIHREENLRGDEEICGHMGGLWFFHIHISSHTEKDDIHITLRGNQTRLIMTLRCLQGSGLAPQHSIFLRRLAH